MAITYTPSANDALYTQYEGIPLQDPRDYAITSPTRVDAKFFLKPVQDEILNLIQRTSSLEGSSVRNYGQFQSQVMASLYPSVTYY